MSTLQYADSSGCSNCPSPTFNAEWYNAFGVTLCKSCKHAEELIAKGNAQQRYLLTDADFKKLGSLTKSNPQHKDWTPMRLYLVSQVQALSYQRHGGPEGLEQALYARDNRAINQRTKARQDARRKVGLCIAWCHVAALSLQHATRAAHR